MEKEPEWALKLEEWGTKKEIEDLEYAHKKKYSATGIERREQEMRRHRRHHQQLEIILA